MQPLAILFLTANLAVSALAAPIANTTNVTSSSCGPSEPEPTPNSPNGAQLGEGGLINHSVQVDNSIPITSRGATVGTWFMPDLGACGFENNSKQLIVAVSWKVYDNYP
jgi:hypothetical protein